jgi:hypothetical protein
LNKLENQFISPLTLLFLLKNLSLELEAQLRLYQQKSVGELLRYDNTIAAKLINIDKIKIEIAEQEKSIEENNLNLKNLITIYKNLESEESELINVISNLEEKFNNLLPSIKVDNTPLGERGKNHKKLFKEQEKNKQIKRVNLNKELNKVRQLKENKIKEKNELSKNIGEIYDINNNLKLQIGGLDLKIKIENLNQTLEINKKAMLDETADKLKTDLELINNLNFSTDIVNDINNRTNLKKSDEKETPISNSLVSKKDLGKRKFSTLNSNKQKNHSSLFTTASLNLESLEGSESPSLLLNPDLSPSDPYVDVSLKSSEREMGDILVTPQPPKLSKVLDKKTNIEKYLEAVKEIILEVEGDIDNEIKRREVQEKFENTMNKSNKRKFKK